MRYVHEQGGGKWALLGEYKKVLLLLALFHRLPRPASQMWYKNGRRRKWPILSQHKSLWEILEASKLSLGQEQDYLLKQVSSMK